MAYILWDNALLGLFVEDDFRFREFASIEILEQLLRTPGEPENWSVGDVCSLGLAGESRVLDDDKLKSFAYMMDDNTFDGLCGVGGESNYECYSGLMGLGGTKFHFRVVDLEGDVVAVDGVNASTGMAPENESMILTLHRTALLDNKVVGVIMQVWE